MAGVAAAAAFWLANNNPGPYFCHRAAALMEIGPRDERRLADRPAGTPVNHCTQGDKAKVVQVFSTEVARISGFNKITDLPQSHSASLARQCLAPVCVPLACCSRPAEEPLRQEFSFYMNMNE